MTFIFLLIEFFDELHFGAQGAVLPVLRQELGLSYAQVGLLLGLPEALSAVLETLIMLLGDTGLRKSLVVGGGILVGACILAIVLAGSFPMLLAAFILLFPASGSFVTLSQATLMDLNRGREPQMMARWTVFGALGNLIGPAMIAGGFAIGLGWRWTYVGLALMAFGLALTVAMRRFPRHLAREKAEDAETEDQPPANLRQVVVDLWAAIRNVRIVRWLILMDVADLLLDVFTGYAALYFADVVGFDETQVALMVTVMMAATLVGNLALVPVLEKTPPRRLVRVSAIVTAVIYILWLVLPFLWAKVGLAVLLRLTTQGWYETLQGEAYASMPGRSGTVMALNSITGLVGAGLVWFVGWFAAQAGLPAAMWLLLAAPVALILFVPTSDSLAL
jgi:FSR family fosmidomycin resistance protein-like MFS transporter